MHWSLVLGPSIIARSASLRAESLSPSTASARANCISGSGLSGCSLQSGSSVLRACSAVTFAPAVSPTKRWAKARWSRVDASNAFQRQTELGQDELAAIGWPRRDFVQVSVG